MYISYECRMWEINVVVVVLVVLWRFGLPIKLSDKDRVTHTTRGV